jgi:hypothetical protein
MAVTPTIKYGGHTYYMVIDSPSPMSYKGKSGYFLKRRSLIKSQLWIICDYMTPAVINRLLIIFKYYAQEVIIIN